jgi:mutator protein MutT
VKPHRDVTAGIIRRAGRILITKRPEGRHLAGLWEFPGGKREAGETLASCLEREILEELGMKVRAERLRFTVFHEYETKEITLHVFDCEDLGMEPAAMDGQEIRWVPPERLSAYPFPPPDLEIIRALAGEGEPSAHPEMKIGHESVSRSELSNFSLVQGNQGIARRRTKVRRTNNPAD